MELSQLFRIEIKKQPTEPTIDPNQQDELILQGKHPNQQSNRKPLMAHVPGGKRPTRKVTRPGVSVFGNDRAPIK